ncbi:MAG: porin family protein [Hyphomonadaceae bacterium]
MKRFAFLAAAAAALMAVPGAAQAQQEGLYLGGGYTHYDGEDANVGGVTGRLGYRFHPNIAVEGEASTGVVDDDGVELDNSYGVYGVGIVPLSPSLEAFGRVGYHNTEVSDGVVSVEQDGVGYGGGLQWNVSDRFGIRGEYTRLEGDDDGVNTFGVGGVWKFGQ